MDERHQQRPGTDPRIPPFKRRTVDGDVFADGGVGPHRGPRHGAGLEAVVLRLLADQRAEIDPAARPERGVARDFDVRVNHAAVADHAVVLDDRVRPDADVFADPGVRTDDRGRMNLRHGASPYFQLTMVPAPVSPARIRVKASGSEKLKTMIGRSLSRHIENAVESITLSWRASASSKLSSV
ncbi:hypothetical protein SDC9_198013 [bioreactor metagenome]|uniref:Uncharacterized protein n=1 Tax=bioreactor metagenome TaxID=1076179 RepID=A0A645IGG9_9ZZZZ